MGRSQRRADRGGGVVLVVVVVLSALLVVAGAALVSLRSAGVRERVLERLEAEVEQRFGIAFSASDFSLSGTRLVLHDVTVGEPGSAPILTIWRVDARLVPVALLRGDLVLDSLELDRPVVDLRNPIPELTGGNVEDDGAVVDIGRVVVKDAAVYGAAVPEVAADWLSRWEAEGLFLAGTLGDEVTEFELESGLVRLEGEDLVRAEVTVGGRVRGPLKGPFEVEDVRVVGSGVELAASGRAGLGEAEAIEASFELEVLPGLLLPGRGLAGHIGVHGSVDVREREGSVQFVAAGLPVSAMASFVPGVETPGVGGPIDFEGSTLDIRADLESAPGAGFGVVGEADVTWRRGAVELAVAKLRADARDGTEVGQQVRFESSLLPSWPGSRALDGTVVLADFAEPAAAELVDGRLDVTVPGLAAVGEMAEELGLSPELLASLPKVGSLALSGDFSGALLDPLAEVEAVWSVAGGEARVTARGRPARLDGSSELVLDALPLAALGTDLGGTVSGRAEVRGRRSSFTGVAAITASALQFGDNSLDRLEIGASTDGELLSISRIEGVGSIGEFSGSGSVPLHLPVDGARFDLALAALPAPLGPVRVEATLEDGVLLAQLPELWLGDASGEAEMRLPLGGLSAVPSLAALLADLPVPDADGPATLRWSFEPATYRIAAASGSTGSSLEVVAGSNGWLEVDLTRPALADGLAQLSALEVRLDGRSATAATPLTLRLGSGTALLEQFRLEGAGLAIRANGRIALEESWGWERAAAEAVAAFELNAEGDVDTAWLAPLDEIVGGTGVLEVVVDLGGSPAEPSGTVRLSGVDLTIDLPRVGALSLPAEGLQVGLAEGRAHLERARLPVGEGALEIEANWDLYAPLSEAEGEILVEGPLLGLERLEAPWSVSDGYLNMTGRVVLGGGTGEFSVSHAVIDAAGPARPSVIGFDLPESDLLPLLSALDLAVDAEVLRASLAGHLSLGPDLDASMGELTVGTLTAGFEGRTSQLEAPLRLRLSDGMLRLEPARVRSGTELFEVSGEARLMEDRAPGRPAAVMIAEVDIGGIGTLDLSLLSPFLPGGYAEGPLALDVALRGTPVELEGHVRLESSEASILLFSPYLTRMSDLQLDLDIRDGRVGIESGRAVVNGGEMLLSGFLFDDARTEVGVEFSKVRYRLDHGLIVLVGGDLSLRRAEGERATLSGTVEVDRGFLTRPIDLDLALLTELLSPTDLSSTEEDPLAQIDLDLDVTTLEGVRVKNNVADLLARWQPMRVRGNLAAPLVEGTLEVEPGGLVHVYGQTVRLDRATLDYSGLPGDEPRLDLELTTSLEDPSIGELEGSDPFVTESGGERNAAPAVEQVTAGLARFYGEQVASRLTESLLGARVSLRPVLVFGETNPIARATVSRDFSANVSVAASVDLRTAENRTYLLDLHDFQRLRGLGVQVFTTDSSGQGGALFERLGFGGQVDEPDLLRVRRKVVPAVEGVSRRGVRRALDLRRGDTLPEGRLFGAEVELGEQLRRRGYVGADVRLDAQPTARPGRVDVVATIDPGPRVRFEFSGEPLKRRLRDSVTVLYRPEEYDPSALEEMRSQAVRVLRSQGFLEPLVEIEVFHDRPDDRGGDRTVVVRTVGGTRIEPLPPVFLGLGEEEAAVLASRFAGPVQRVELALGLPGADRLLHDTLRSLGYLEPRILSRYTGLEGGVLTVQIDPGDRRRIARLVVDGVDAQEGARLLEMTPLAVGDPLRADRLALAVLAIERDLESRGHRRARVRVSSAAGGVPLEEVLTLEVDPGPLHRVAEVDFTGLGSTRQSWAERVSGIEPESPLVADALSRARRDLYSTGLFSSVSTVVSDSSGDETVVFELAERERWEVGLGARWDSDNGIAALVDVADRNLFGRSVTLGLRALYASDDQSLRLWSEIPRLWSRRGSLELFGLSRDRTDRGIITEQVESTLQYSLSFGEHWTGRTYGRYRDTRLSEEEPDDFFPLNERIRSPVLGLQAIYDSRGGATLPDAGLVASIDLSGSDDFIGGDFRYARLFGQIGLHLPAGSFAGRGLTWSQSLRAGVAEAFDQELLRDVRFFAGGEFSVRGYETESLGPQERLGSLVRPLGGEALLVVNQELRARVTGDLVALVFLDAGNVWEVKGDFGSDLSTSVGVGVRALTPAGLLRLDLAHALDRRQFDPEFKLYFGFGSTF